MASDFDRDNSIDALLRGARRDPAPAGNVEAGPACLDAETIAAWADGGLDADRVRAIETHVADCARCQSFSAAFFATGDPVTASAPKVVPFRQNRVMYWLPIAAGTIAATLVIWIGGRDKNDVRPEAQAAMADSRAAQTLPPSADASRLQEKQAQQGNAAAPADAKRLERKEAAPVEPRADRAKKEAATANLSRQVAAEPVASPAPARLATPPPPAMAGPPPPPAVVVPPPPAPVAAAPPVRTTASGAVTGVASGAGGGVRQAAESFAKVEPRVIAEFSSVLAQSSTISGLPPTAGVVGGVAGGGAGRGGRGGGGGGGRGAAIAYDAVNVSAPPFYWRILSTDTIERSVDRLVWEPIAIDPPARGLAGGAAPSATVCWIIGRAGLVLLTTDGKEFTRAAQPAPADLISITAQDALRATVTTVGGQAFTTTDGGKSWK